MAVKPEPNSVSPSEHPPSGSPNRSEPSAAPVGPTEAPTGARSDPLWAVPLYVGGLVLVFIGERVLEPMPWARGVATVLGVLAVLGSTAVRFSPRFRVGGERRDVERLMAILSFFGVLGLVVYAMTTDWGMDRLGLSTAETETQERIKGILTIGWVALVLVAVVPMSFAATALYPMRRAIMPEARRARAAAASGLALVLAALYGALFVYAAGAPHIEIDYSYFKTSRPSESTRRMAESLTAPIKVTAFFPDVNEVRREVDTYLHDLARNNRNLEITIQDRLLVPKLARDLHATQDGVVILSKDKTVETLTIGTDMQSARPKLKTLDRDFQEHLLKLLRARRTAYLTVGHGEMNEPKSEATEPDRAASIVRTLLQKQNYLVKDLGLGQGLGNDVPEDADIVLVLGPNEPFANEEIAALSRYADHGGKLLLALDPDALSPREFEVAATGPSESAEGEAGEEPTPPKPAASASAKPKPSGSAAKPKSKPAPSGAAAATKPKPSPSASAAAAKPKPSPSASARALGKTPPSGSALAKAPKPAGSAKPAEAKKTAETETKAPLPDTPLARTLSALAAIAGISLDGGVLANDREHLRRRFNDSDHTLLITNSFSSHASVSTLSRNSPRAAIVTFGAAPLEKAPGGTTKVDFAVRTRPSTFADLNHNYMFDDATEHRATFNIAAAVSQPAKSPRPKPVTPEPKKDEKAADKDKKKDDKKPPPDEMRAFVIGDADAFSDIVLSNVVANQVLLLDAIRWLGGEESFAGEVTTEEDVRIEHTKQKDQVWFYATIFGAPALVLGLGLFYVMRTRRTRSKGGGR